MDSSNLPPIPKLLDYPVTIALTLDIVLTSIMLVVVARFDATGGVLTISLLIVLAFIGTVTFCSLFTIPNDEATAAVIGGLTASFGAVIAFWLGRKGPPNG